MGTSTGCEEAASFLGSDVLLDFPTARGFGRPCGGTAAVGFGAFNVGLAVAWGISTHQAYNQGIQRTFGVIVIFLLVHCPRSCDRCAWGPEDPRPGIGSVLVSEFSEWGKRNDSSSESCSRLRHAACASPLRDFAKRVCFGRSWLSEAAPEASRCCCFAARLLWEPFWEPRLPECGPLFAFPPRLMMLLSKVLPASESVSEDGLPRLRPA